ncbi:hypothetical protein [Georgenia thermotolerans]|uniref:DUF998 domain-containing protein n=1 Tax=Georgenia thermotolerans TaxID=527326 RepID=A0A7J5UNA3_9MICO|nr:hypothetical protein [Georgenia thermotolerans]KAE8763750.1 hypothetical protein GB883_12460 [Georgenia thermotolerans]
MVIDAPSLTARPGARARDMVASGLRVVLRVPAILLLGASVVLGIQAWWSRFSVCFVGGEPPVAGLPQDGAGGCLALQDHLYDYYVPDDPWVPIADAAQREGLSLLALGLGVALVSVSLGGRWFVWPLSLAGGAAMGAMWVGTGVPVWRSGLAGEPVGFEDWMAASGWSVLTVLVAPGLAALAWFHGGRDARLVAVFWAAMAIVPWEFFFTLFLAPSHDTSPLRGFFRCAVVAVAAVAVALTLLPVGVRQRMARPLGRAGQVVMTVLRRAAARLRELDERVMPARRE